MIRGSRWTPTEDLRFLPVEIVEPSDREDEHAPVDAGDPAGMIEIELVGGHRIRINGGYDPEALARLIPVLATTRVWLAAGVTDTSRGLGRGDAPAGLVHRASLRVLR